MAIATKSINANSLCQLHKSLQFYLSPVSLSQNAILKGLLYSSFAMARIITTKTVTIALQRAGATDHFLHKFFKNQTSSQNM